MKWFLMALKRYIDFNGSSRRSEYWYFYLFCVIIIFVLGFLALYVPPISFLLIIFYLGIIIPLIAAGVRRMHDVGKSGWYLLIPIYNLILALTPGQMGANEYGPDPKDLAFEDEINQIGQKG